MRVVGFFPAFVLPVLLAMPCSAQMPGRRHPNASGQSYTLRGRVVDADTGDAILHARIQLRATAGTSGMGTANGSEFEFINLSVEALYELTVEADGYKDVRDFVDSSAAVTGFLLIHMQRIKTPVRRGGAQVSARLLQLPPAAQEAYQHGVECLYGKHDAVASVPFFQETLKLAPQFYEAHYQEGMAYRDLGRARESEAAFRRAIEASEGRFSRAQFALASLLSDEKKFAEAESAARKGLEGENTSAPGHYELARSLLGQGKASEAEAEAHATLAMSRELPQTYLLLAAVYEGRNQMQQAVKELDRYLLAVPKGPVSDSVRAVRQDLQRRLLASK